MRYFDYNNACVTAQDMRWSGRLRH